MSFNSANLFPPANLIWREIDFSLCTHVGPRVHVEEKKRGRVREKETERSVCHWRVCLGVRYEPAVALNKELKRTVSRNIPASHNK